MWRRSQEGSATEAAKQLVEDTAGSAKGVVESVESKVESKVKPSQ
jgi:hypothetical protein